MALHYTIIIPSRQGGEYLKQCVSSALAQTYPEFELVVLDNCSDDDSVAWLDGLDDSRIKIFTSPQVLSIEENWARALSIPKKEFMVLVGHDDLLDPNYLEVVSELIRRYPYAALYLTHFRLIDENGKRIRSCSPQPVHETAAQFLSARITGGRDSFGTGYVMRSQDYDRAGGIPPFEKLLFADDALWISLMQKGEKVTAFEECFSYRYHAGSTSGLADWEAYLVAANQMVSFLDEQKKSHPNIAEVLKNAQPPYPLCYYQHIYFVALMQAIKSDTRLDLASVRSSIVREVARQDLDQVHHLSDSRQIRMMELVAASTPLRKVSSTFLHWRRKMKKALWQN